MALIFNTYTVSTTDPVFKYLSTGIKNVKLNLIKLHTIFSGHIIVWPHINITKIESDYDVV